MTEFDWEQAHRTRNPKTIAWLEKIHKTTITEAEFIKQYNALPHHQGRTSTKRPAALYQYLKKRFGFFQ